MQRQGLTARHAGGVMHGWRMGLGMTNSVNPPQISPDGNFWWDGTRWNPMPSQPPQFTAPQQPMQPYAPHPGSPATIQPVAAHFPTQQQTDTSRLLAWLVALAPVGFTMAMFVGLALFGTTALGRDAAGGFALAVGGLLLIASVVIVGIDATKVRANGWETGDTTPGVVFATLLFYILAVPYYLIKRARTVGSGALMPVLFISVFLANAVLYGIL